MNKQRLLELAGVLLDENVPLASRPKKGYQQINDLTAAFLIDPEDLQQLAESGLLFICDGFSKGRLIIKPLFRTRRDIETDVGRTNFDIEFVQN